MSSSKALLPALSLVVVLVLGCTAQQKKDAKTGLDAADAVCLIDKAAPELVVEVAPELLVACAIEERFSPDVRKLLEAERRAAARRAAAKPASSK